MNVILIASDHGGFRLKERLKKYLKDIGFIPKDLGTNSLDSCDYPDLAAELAGYISAGKYKQGLLVCKSGIGNSIVANRFPGVRAALCYNIRAARLSREHNDSNVLVLGAIFVKENLAKRILRVWLNTKFKAGRHKRRLNKIRQIEKRLKR